MVGAKSYSITPWLHNGVLTRQGNQIVPVEPLRGSEIILHNLFIMVEHVPVASGIRKFGEASVGKARPNRKGRRGALGQLLRPTAAAN